MDFVRIWNASTWTIVRSANTNTDVNGVDFSPDGMYVAAALNDDTINIYHASNLTSIHGAISVDVGSGDQVNNVEFSPDSSTVAVAIGRSGKRRHQRRGCRDRVQTGGNSTPLIPTARTGSTTSAFSPDGQYMALAGNSEIYIVNTTSRATSMDVHQPTCCRQRRRMVARRQLHFDVRRLGRTIRQL